MAPKLIELRPDRKLLDPDFNGYKLSLEKIELLQEKLEVSVNRVLPNHDQYSFLHAKLFGMHNHLTGETINNKTSIYFIDKQWRVLKTYLNEISGTIASPTEVWKIPKQRECHIGDYNVTLKFASENIAVASDGTGLLYILNTFSRSTDAYWQVEFSDEVIEPGKRFIIQDVGFVETEDNQSLLHCLLVSIEQDEKENEKHCTFIRWVSLLKNNENLWGVIALRELKCKGGTYYLYFEPKCTALYCISDNGIKFTLDSENPIIEAENSPQHVEKKNYFWIQSKDDIVLKFKCPENFERNCFSVTSQSTEMQIAYRDKTLISGKLYNRIDSELTTWTTNNEFIEVTLTKSEVGLMWPEFIEGDQTGEHIVDPSVIEEMHERLAHLCSDSEVSAGECPGGTTFNSQQMEDCDFEDDKYAVFERISLTHEITHKANIGSHQVLLTAKLNDDLPPAFATRHDVDACLWQPQETEEKLLTHVGTLLAFGYIQASKQQRKFTESAPDLSYSVICESNQHLFIYRQNKSVTSGRLRNRVTGQNVEKIAQQQVISLPKEEEVLGIYAVNHTLFLLTENMIMAFKM